MPTTDHRTHPNAIRQYRRKRGLRLRDVARAIGLASHEHIAHWEKGRGLPSLANALKLQLVLQCPIEVLFLDLRNALREDIQLRLNPPPNDSA